MKGVLLYDKAVIRDIDLRLLDKMWTVATVTWMTMTSLAPGVMVECRLFTAGPMRYKET